MSAVAFDVVSALGWALVHFVWQGAAVGMAAVLALMLLRNAPPQVRYAVACAALVVCAALPVTSLLRSLDVDGPAVAVSTAIAVPAAPSATDLPVVTFSSWRSALQFYLPWIVMVWSLGAAALALRMAFGVAWVERIRRKHADAIDPAWQVRLDLLAVKLGLRRDVSLRITEDLDSPVAAGWWRPMVLVPAALIARMPPELLEALLAHELAHVKRLDYVVNLIQSAIEALLFYHPVVWWLSRQIRIERERIADDLAAKAIGDPRRMALALQRLDLLLSDAPLPAPRFVPAANGALLMPRIQHLIRPSQHALGWKAAWPIVGLSAICLTVFAQGQPATTEPAATPVTVYDADASRPARDGAYALVRDGRDSMTVSGTTRDIRAAERAKSRVQGDFLWFRRNDKAYVVQDPAILARVNAAWKPTEALSAEMETLSGKMDVHSKKMQALSEKMEALGDRNAPATAEMEKIGAEMEAVSHQQQAIADKMRNVGERMRTADDTQRDTLEREMGALQAQMAPLQARMEAHGRAMSRQAQRTTAAQEPMHALSRQMEEASKPMDALGRQMEELGKRQEKLSRDADRVVRTVIDDALKTGKALPTSTFD